MKFVIVFVACIAVALAAPGKDDTVLKYDADVREDGYNFAWVKNLLLTNHFH